MLINLHVCVTTYCLGRQIIDIISFTNSANIEIELDGWFAEREDLKIQVSIRACGCMN